MEERPPLRKPIALSVQKSCVGPLFARLRKGQSYWWFGLNVMGACLLKTPTA